MANEAANRLKYLMAQGDIDFTNGADVFIIILMASGFVFNAGLHHQYSEVVANELPTANGYVRGTMVLLNVVVTENDPDDRTEIVWDNVTWTAAGGAIGPSPGAIIYDQTDPNDSLVGFIDFGGDQSQADGGTVTIINPEVRVL
jgi:hypothetical protein